MNSKSGFEFAAPWWRRTRLLYSSGAETLVVDIPGRGLRVFRDVPARVYEMLKQSPEVRAVSVADGGRPFAMAEAC